MSDEIFDRIIERLDRMEANILSAMREGVDSFNRECDVRRTRRINQRLMRLEQPDSED